MTRKLFWTNICTFFVLNLFAQISPVTVKGRLIGKSEYEPLPYATISIANVSAPETPIKRLATNHKGVFSTTLSTGNYTFSFHFVGKKTLQKSVEVFVNKEEINLGEILMTEEATALDEVRIVAQKPLVKVEVDKIIYSLRDDPESRTSNVLDMLRKVPLITVDAKDEIQLKGSSSYKIFLNGKPSNMISSNPSQVLKSMPANSIKDIEVMTNPGAKYDAEGIGGIINIVTDKKVDEGYLGSVNLGADTQRSFNIGTYLSFKYGKWGVTTNANTYQYRSPMSESYYCRHDFSTSPQTNLEQHGKSGYKGDGAFISGIVSYELDTLNLFSISLNGYGGTGTDTSVQGVLSKGFFNYRYNRASENKSKYDSYDFSTDYQRSFPKKGELLTFSYKYTLKPNGSNGYTEISDTAGVPMLRKEEEYRMRNQNDTQGKEQTGQVDYINPLTSNHTIETGLKYIFRDNESKTLNEFCDFNTSKWMEDILRKNDLEHQQSVTSVYGSYSYKENKIGAKIGFRGEYTDQKVRYINSENPNPTPVKTYFFDLVPSAMLSYQLGMTHTFRLAYNMRLSRPGIWYLNPYINKTDPLNISYGNPKLESEKNHNISFNYGTFSQRLNINATVSYSLTNNAITSYQVVKKGTTHQTYGNIGKSQSVGIDGYLNWRPAVALNIYMNGGLSYVDIQSTNAFFLRNKGVSFRTFTGVTYTFPDALRLSVNGGYFGSQVELQNKREPFYYLSFNATKSFLDKKLDISLHISNPFWKYMDLKLITTGNKFSSESLFRSKQRTIGINIAYRFGTLKSSMKKIKRGITNDDLKSTGDNSQQRGGGESIGGSM